MSKPTHMTNSQVLHLIRDSLEQYGFKASVDYDEPGNRQVTLNTHDPDQEFAILLDIEEVYWEPTIRAYKGVRVT